jgi:Lar family restriction alleviation protein
MQSEKLKPCPFCGGSDVHLRHHQANQMSWVSCVGCGLEAPSETGVTDDEAVAYWNRRTEAALSAAEPVMYVSQRGVSCSPEFYENLVDSSRKNWQPLYTAPPALTAQVQDVAVPSTDMRALQSWVYQQRISLQTNDPEYFAKYGVWKAVGAQIRSMLAAEPAKQEG